MQNKKGLVVIILVLVAVLAIAGVAYAALGAAEPGNVPQIASSASGGTSSAETDAGASEVSQNAEAPGSEDASSAEEMFLPDFSVASLDGVSTQLSSVYGKPAIVGFWATWCPPCNTEAPVIQKLYETYGDQVNFMMIDSASDGRDNLEVVTSWLAEGNYSYPVYIDETGEAAMAAQIYYLPTMFVLDKEGKVLTAFSGALDEEGGTQLLEQLLALE